MTLSFLCSAIIGAAKNTMKAWRFVVAVMLLSLVIMAGCDVRPFNEFSGDNNGSEESGEEDDGDGANGDEEMPDETVPLDLTADPPTIVTSVNMAGTTQIEVEDAEADRMYTFDVTTQPTNGRPEIDVNTGLLTYTPDADFIGDDLIIVTVTDDGEPARSGTIEINIMVN